MATTPPEARTIIRYANRKLYDPAASLHVTADSLLQLVQLGTPFRVIGCKDDVDYTQVVLASVLARLARRPGAKVDEALLVRAIKSYRQAVRPAPAPEPANAPHV